MSRDLTTCDPHSLTVDEIVSIQNELKRLRYDKETIELLLNGPTIGSMIKNVMGSKNPADGIMKTMKSLKGLLFNPNKLSKEIEPIKDRLSEMVSNQELHQD